MTSAPAPSSCSPGYSLAVSHRARVNAWQDRKEMAEQQRVSRNLWQTIAEPERAALARLVHSTLLDLADHVDEWLPDALSPFDGDQLDLVIGLQLPKLTEADVNGQFEADSEARRVAAALLQMERELRE